MIKNRENRDQKQFSPMSRLYDVHSIRVKFPSSQVLIAFLKPFTSLVNNLDIIDNIVVNPKKYGVNLIPPVVFPKLFFLERG